MSRTIEDLHAELSDPRFRWWRSARLVGLPASVFLYIVVVLQLTQGNGLRFMHHPLGLIIVGIWPCYLGALLIAQPRNYLECLSLHRMLRQARRGIEIDVGTPRRRDRISTVFGGIFILLIGLLFLTGGISGL